MPMRDALESIDYGLFAIGGAVVLVALVMTFVTYLSARDPLRGSPLRLQRLTPVQVWICLACSIFGGIAGMAFSKPLTPATADKETREVWQGIVGANFSDVLVIVVCFAVARRAFRSGLRGFGLTRRPIGRDLLLALLVLPAAFAMCAGLLWLTEHAIHLVRPDFRPVEHSVFKSLADAATPAWIRVLAVVGAFVFAPVAEELLFRGILQSSLTHILAPRGHSMRHCWLAIVIVGTFFGAMHSATPQNVPALAALGMLLGFLYERTGSLTLTIFVHMLFNGKSLLWYALLPESGG